MEAFLATLALYRAALIRGARLALQNWPVPGSFFAYGLLLSGTAFVVPHLGLLGGFLLALAAAACSGSFLYLVEMIVRTSRVTLADFQRSFGVYLWDVLAVNFVLWILTTVVNLAAEGSEQAALFRYFFQLLVAVFFNAVPELIYLGHHSAVSLLAESYRFISDNWIEWFPPNLLLLGVLVVFWEATPTSSPTVGVAKLAAAGLFVYFMMVVRGILFIELSQTSRRGRVFRHKMNG